VSPSDISKAMKALGYSEADALALICKLDEQRKDAAREANAERQRRFRDRNGYNSVTPVTRDIVTSVTDITRDSVTEDRAYKETTRAPVFPVGEPNGSPQLELETPICPQVAAKPKRDSKRGSRLPDDWAPAERTIEICIAMGYSRQFLLGEGLDGFRDFWCGLAGSKALKLDWDKTFCNRMRERPDRQKITSSARDGPSIRSFQKVYAI